MDLQTLRDLVCLFLILAAAGALWIFILYLILGRIAALDNENKRLRLSP